MEKNHLFISSRMLILIILFSFSCFCLSAQDLNPANWPHLKGYWKFQNISQLTQATVGNDLSVFGTHQAVPGPSYGDTAIRIAIGSYYRCYHNIAPNGGGTKVNEYTLMFDFKVLNFDRWHTFFQTDTTNADDGECFIRPANSPPVARIGCAATSYTPDSVLANKWYRLVISVKLGHFYRYYFNGNLVLDGDTQDLDDRFSLTPLILFFADNNQEDDTIDIASLAIFDSCLSSSDVATIGSIDPCVVHPPSVNLGADTALCSYSSFSKNAGSGFASYLWSTGETIASVTFDKNKVGLGQHNIWVRVTDINGCRDFDTMNVNFISPPTVNLGADKVFCQGQSVNIVAGISFTNQYLWKYLPSGDTLSTMSNITIDSSGRYVALVTSQFGCVNSDTIVVVVNQNPSKPIITITGKPNFCKGDSVKLDGPGSFTKYLWTNGSKLKQIYVKISDTLKIKITDKNGCESPFSDSVVVIVFNLPSVPVIQIIGDTSFCTGDSVILRVPTTFAGYNWSNGIYTQQQIIKTNGKYSVIVTDFNGCISPASRKVTVTIYSLPQKPVISTSGQTTFCDGDSIVLIAPAGYQQYTWNDGSNNAQRTEKQTGLFYVYVKDANNCISPISDTMNIKVNPNPLKPLIIVTGDTNICSDDSTKLSAPAGYSAYLWTDNSITQSIIISSTGSYRVRVENNFGCKSVWSENRSIFEYPVIPKPQIISLTLDTLKCSTTADSYRWYRNGILMYGSNIVIKATPSGYYKVQAGIGKCWSEISDSLYHQSTYIAEINNRQIKLLIYPNPANSEVFIRVNNLLGLGDVFIKISDINGKNVLENKTSFIELSSGVSIKIQNLSQGIYLVKVITPGKIFSGRIQKM